MLHASAGAVATASLTRSTARCRRRRAAGRNGTGLLRRARMGEKLSKCERNAETPMVSDRRLV